MKECVDNLKAEDDKEKLMSSLWGAERCLRVLDSVSVAAILARYLTWCIDRNANVRARMCVFFF